MNKMREGKRKKDKRQKKMESGCKGSRGTESFTFTPTSPTSLSLGARSTPPHIRSGKRLGGIVIALSPESEAWLIRALAGEIESRGLVD